MKTVTGHPEDGETYPAPPPRSALPSSFFARSVLEMLWFVSFIRHGPSVTRPYRINSMTIVPCSSPPLLDGQHNFRDMGGLPAQGGCIVRPGVLYRSGDLGSLTDRDVAILEDIGIALVIDFRSERERIKRPNRPISTAKAVRQLAITDVARDMVTESLPRNDPAEIEALLVWEYRRIVRENGAEYRLFLEELAQTPHLPLVFHCTAGKDRTGLAALFLLTALEVDFDAILDDYVASNRCNAALTKKIISRMNARTQNGEAWRPLLEVKKDYLDAALETIGQRHGGLQSFVRDVLKADAGRLKKRFLEPAKGYR